MNTFEAIYQRRAVKHYVPRMTKSERVQHYPASVATQGPDKIEDFKQPAPGKY